MENLERLDSNFFQKKYLHTEKILKGRYTQMLNQLGLVTDGNHLTIAAEYSTNDGIRYLRGQDVSTDMFIDERNAVYIPESEFNKLKRSHIFRNDVLVTIVGANTGCVGFVHSPPSKLTANCKLGIARVNDDINSAYLYLFLITKFGQNQIHRNIRGGGQTGLILPDFRALKIVRLSKDFENIVAESVLQVHRLFESSKVAYSNTVNYFLEQLGLLNWTPTKSTINVKSIKESFYNTGRLDAEYYQPKYSEIVEHVKQRPFDYLGNLVQIRKSIEPGSDAYLTEGIPFIRVADLSKFGLSAPEIFLDPNEYDIDTLMPKKDSVLLSKDGSVGVAYKMEEDKMVITSGAILHLTVTDKKILPDYLCIVLNSMVVQFQAERDAGGSIIQHWKPEEIKQVVVPILPFDIQEKITSLVQESFSMQQQSKQLLEVAKHAVEIAIEENEDAAIRWLNQQNTKQ